MKITGFDPVIVTPDVDSVIRVFEGLGFARTHSPVLEVKTGEVHSYRMENADGYHVDVVSPARDITRDEMVIRMNVDDFEAAYATLEAHGFRNVHKGNATFDTKTATSATLESPSGFRIAVVKHIKG